MQVSVDFSVNGKVQGVFFRKYTQEKARQLGLYGFVQNNSDGSVSGVLEGDEPKVDIMMDWLQHTGSPASRIESAKFSEKKIIESSQYKSFDIRR
ncbi:hypothetical protein O3M35_001836 [Rhynocoris fuscipes]|uniref:Acylphosphatase n=1 Tax=Rhynocoris fuscipes TaxID=488301 RepID=A0AAW1CUT1_9HEMI